MTSFQVSSKVSLDFAGRIGNYPGFGLGLTVAPTAGVSVALSAKKRLHITVGATIPTGIGEAKLGGWVAAGISY